jgi:hypothetical protein
MDMQKDQYDYYVFDLEGSNLYEMSFEEREEWLAKAPRRVQDESKLSEGVMMLLAERRRLLERREGGR